MKKNAVAQGVVHRVPKDFMRELQTHAAALMHWNSLTPLARNEWICWIVSVKKIETRKNHIERACVELKSGKRRPCCFAGCPHR